jgi:flagellar motor switch protein FliN
MAKEMNFDKIESVPIPVHAVLDRKVMKLGELLSLNEGDVVAMPRPAGENVSIFAGGALIGWGEVVLIDGAMAVRVAELRDPAAEADGRKN